MHLTVLDSGASAHGCWHAEVEMAGSETLALVSPVHQDMIISRLGVFGVNSEDIVLSCSDKNWLYVGTVYTYTS